MLRSVSKSLVLCNAFWQSDMISDHFGFLLILDRFVTIRILAEYTSTFKQMLLLLLQLSYITKDSTIPFLSSS